MKRRRQLFGRMLAECCRLDSLIEALGRRGRGQHIVTMVEGGDDGDDDGEVEDEEPMTSFDSHSGRATTAKDCCSIIEPRECDHTHAHHRLIMSSPPLFERSEPHHSSSSVLLSRPLSPCLLLLLWLLKLATTTAMPLAASLLLVVGLFGAAPPPAAAMIRPSCTCIIFEDTFGKDLGTFNSPDWPVP